MTLDSPFIAATAALRRPGHRQALGVAVALVVAAHAGLLGQVPSPAPRAAQTQTLRSATVQVRQIVVPRAQVVAGSGAAADQALPPSRPALAATGPASVPAALLTPRPTAETVVTGPADAADGIAPLPDGMAVPVYATQLPPAATLHYTLRRGGLQGQARLHWLPAAGGYRLSLQGQAMGAPLVSWVSQGGFDEAGIAPTRYTESRRGRELRAANFQRDAGRITYSGPTVEHALWPGAQDRLSWMLHLGAVLAANPALAQPGAQVAMWVVGSRGDAEVWTFDVRGLETLDLPSGTVAQAVHLHRAPRRPYDTIADVWLDPARHHLPVRVWLRVRATGEGADYQLERLEAP